MKINSSGTSDLVNSTFLGGGGDDFGYGISIDSDGTRVISGLTYSTLNFPTTNGAYDRTHNGGKPWQIDAFINTLCFDKVQEPVFYFFN